MQTRRALGIAALGAVILAAISFAVADVSIANANGCVGSADPCSDRMIPSIAVWFALLGALALLVSILPAINWFIVSIHHTRHEDQDEQDDQAAADLEVARRPLLRRFAYEEDEA